MCSGVGAKGRYRCAKDVRAALDRYREALDVLRNSSSDRVTASGLRLSRANEPRVNPAATVGSALAFISTLGAS